jgi:uncharacterized protein (TIGR02117 family)
MRKLAKWIGFGLLALLGLLLIATVLTARSADPALWPPAPGAPTIEIHVVNHGYHTGIAVLRTAAAGVARERGLSALLAVTERFADYRWLEIGWGEENFYRAVPDVASLTVGLAARALFHPGNVSVMHVVGLSRHPRASFPHSDIVPIGLSEAGFARLAERLDASLARTGPDGAPEDLGPGLYGPSRFFRAVETFYAFNVCNHWLARLLSAAGLPTAPIPATLPHGLLLDLQWRSGLKPLPRYP